MHDRCVDWESEEIVPESEATVRYRWFTANSLIETVNKQNNVCAVVFLGRIMHLHVWNVGQIYSFVDEMNIFHSIVLKIFVECIKSLSTFVLSTVNWVCCLHFNKNRNATQNQMDEMDFYFNNAICDVQARGARMRCWMHFTSLISLKNTNNFSLYYW